jgi:hypothetical protein
MSPSETTPAKSFLDTSTVHKLQLGPAIQRAYLAKAIPHNWYINNYVRMEFYRRVIIECVEIYFESGDPIYTSLGDVFNSYAERFGRAPKLAAAVMANMETDGYSLSSPADKEALRQKLQDFAFTMALQISETFRNMGKDPTRCSRVPHPIRLPRNASQREAVLRSAALTFTMDHECRKRCTVQHLFESQPYKGKLHAIRATATNDGNLERIRKAIDTAYKDPSAITCRSCGKMGDAIIASSLDATWKLHSMDGAHRLISEAINLEFEIHPSLAALKRSARSDNTQTG